MSFRRSLIEKSKKKDGTLATNWYVINPEISQSAGYANHSYYFAIYINGKNYCYEADNPFYVVDNGSGSYFYIIFPYDGTLRNGTKFTSGTLLGTKNGLTYYKEQYARSSKLSSNKDIYLWE